MAGFRDFVTDATPVRVGIDIYLPSLQPEAFEYNFMGVATINQKVHDCALINFLLQR